MDVKKITENRKEKREKMKINASMGIAGIVGFCWNC